MNYKPDERAWMAYLYGEMAAADKLRFEQYIAANAEAERELEDFHNLRRMLSQSKDKEVIAPPIVVAPSASTSQRPGHFRYVPYFKTIATIAASMLIIILVGKWADVQVMLSPQSFILRFGALPEEQGPSQQPAAAAVSTEQVHEMINEALHKNNTTVKQELGETQREIEASIRTVLAQDRGRADQLAREAATASQEQIRKYVETIRAENMQQVKEYFQLTSAEQKQYIENLLVDFSKYLQQQRNNDLQLVETRMSSLEQNTNIFRHETEQILSSIITTVGNPATGEIKN